MILVHFKNPWAMIGLTNNNKIDLILTTFNLAGYNVFFIPTEEFVKRVPNPKERSHN
jgi:hypothetical protein